MIDFHIELNGQMPLSSMIMYAKSLGLRVIALIAAAEYIPHTGKTCAAFLNAPTNCSPSLSLLKEKQEVIQKLAVYYDMQIFFGVQLRHIPPALLEETVRFYRSCGISLIGVYGESISDIVEKGTNFSAVMAKADILFNPGLIDEECVKLAKENNVFLEISTHPKHAYANAHIAKLANQYGAKLVLGSSAQILHEIHSPEMQSRFLKGACIESHDSYELFQKLQQINNV